MARCDEGYLCEVCGREVKGIAESDLYLRYVIGEIEAGDLLGSPERHIRCNAFLAQFVVDPAFEPVRMEGPFSKEFLNAEEAAQRESLVTRGWRRLREIRKLGVPISEYPLRDVTMEDGGSKMEDGDTSR